MEGKLTIYQRRDLYLAIRFGGVLNITEDVQILHKLGYLKKDSVSALDGRDWWLVPTQKAKALFSKGKTA